MVGGEDCVLNMLAQMGWCVCGDIHPNLLFSQISGAERKRAKPKAPWKLSKGCWEMDLLLRTLEKNGLSKDSTKSELLEASGPSQPKLSCQT